MRSWRSCSSYTNFTRIEAGKQVPFVYYEYNVRKGLVPKYGGERFPLLPYAMLYNEDQYYVLGYSNHHRKTSTFRVDRMPPTILEDSVVPRHTDFDPADDTVNIFSMYDAKLQQVELLCENRVMNDVIDRLGEDVHTKSVATKHFIPTVEVSVNQTLFTRTFHIS